MKPMTRPKRWLLVAWLTFLEALLTLAGADQPTKKGGRPMNRNLALIVLILVSLALAASILACAAGGVTCYSTYPGCAETAEVIEIHSGAHP